MKIYGTAKGGAISTKDFGVAFGGGAAPESTELWAITATGQEEAFSTAITILAQLFETGHVLMGETITRFDANLSKQGSPTGDITARIIGPADASPANEEKLNMGTLDSEELTGSYVTHTFENPDGDSYVLEDGDRLALYFSGNDTDRPLWQMSPTDSSEDYTEGSYYSSGSWTPRTRDFTMAVWGY